MQHTYTNYEKYKNIIKEHKNIPIHKVQNMVIQNKIVRYNTKFLMHKNTKIKNTNIKNTNEDKAMKNILIQKNK